jgi:hypothetical protein
MMIITRKHLPRRTFLRGVGATLALPLLDGMMPAFTAIGKAAARPATRMGTFYLPNGMIMPNWTPKTVGANFEFSPTLKALEPFRERVLVISGLNSEPAKALPDEGQGDHSRGPGSFLTGAHIKKSEGADIRSGVSLDQIAARELGNETQLASLEIGLDSSEFPGACDIGYSCAYSGTVSWRDATTPLPMENDPRRVFERLFGASDTTDPRDRRLQLQKQRSLLDSVIPDVNRLATGLGSSDRVKLSQYLEAVRDIERRIQMTEAQNSRELPLMEQPGGTPATFTEHVEIMCDLLLLAFQTDMTRVFTFMLGREQTGRVFPEIGIPDGHHGLSHHGGDTVKMAKVSTINAYAVQQFAKFVEKLRTTPDGDGSLLDHSMIMYGAGISDGNLHNHNDLPILLVGGGGQIRGGRHLKYAPDTPLMNLGATLLDKMGVPFERLGDANGKLAELSAIS